MSLPARFGKLSARCALTLALVLCPLAARSQETGEEGTSAASPPASGLAIQPAAPSLPALELTTDLVYRLLVAEIALQRDHLDLALTTYTGLVQTTHDPRLAQRATEVALYTHRLDAILTALTKWLELAPHSLMARQTLTAVALSQPNLPPLKDVLLQMLQADAPQVAEDFRNIELMLLQHPDHAASLRLAQALGAVYPEVPEAQYLLGSTAFLAAQPAQALVAARAALKLRPEWETALLLEGRVLQVTDPPAAPDFYRDALARNQHAVELRLAYARFLVESKDYSGARREFETVLQQSPNHPDLAVALALLNLQLRQDDAAIALLRQALDQKYHDPAVAYFYLGQAYEDKKEWQQALDSYQAVGSGDEKIPAQIRVALVWAKLQQPQRGLTLLDQLQTQNPDQDELRILAQEQIQREQGQFQAAFAIITAGLQYHPDAPDLLYERAIVADKLDLMEVVEKDLRAVIRLRPDYAQAYNALGYSWADRRLNLEEALTLVRKALTLAPQDPFIMDSLGWTQFRLGQLDSALGTLRQAYTLQADPEIAAHLGEVEWVLGLQGEARHTWHEAQKSDPANEVLNATVKRLEH